MLVIALLAVLCLAGTASAIRLQAGDILIIGDGEVTPERLPADHNAPVRFRMHGRISTVSGDLPPILRDFRFEFDRHGAIRSDGLPVCTLAQLEATTVPRARKICPGSIIGRGTGQAVVKFPEQAPIDVSSPVTIFNGPHGVGHWTWYFHAYNTVPVPATVLFPVEIEKIDKGRYGYEVAAEFPRLAGGYGIPVAADIAVGREWTFRGDRLSYLNARCVDGRFQARGEFNFKDGTWLQGTFIEPCRALP